MYVVTFWVTFQILKHICLHTYPLWDSRCRTVLSRVPGSPCVTLCGEGAADSSSASELTGLTFLMSPDLPCCILVCFFHIGGCSSALGVILFDYLQIWQFSWVVIVLKGHWAEAVHFYWCWKNIIFYEFPRYSPNYVYCTLLSTVAVNSSFVFSYLRGLDLSSQTCI